MITLSPRYCINLGRTTWDLGQQSVWLNMASGTLAEEFEQCRKFTCIFALERWGGLTGLEIVVWSIVHTVLVNCSVHEDEVLTRRVHCWIASVEGVVVDL